jgi:hypothetical protein
MAAAGPLGLKTTVWARRCKSFPHAEGLAGSRDGAADTRSQTRAWPETCCDATGMTRQAMRRRRRITLALIALAVAVPIAVDAGVRPRVTRLRRMVVVGDSILAGFVSGGLVKRDQKRSAPKLLARRAGVRLSQPFMSNDGVPPPLRIEDRNGNGRLDAAEVRRGTTDVGFRRGPGRRVRTLAVPGEDMTSVFERIDAEDVLSDLASGDADGRDILKFLILGLPLRDDSVSQLTRARDLRPSFLTVWLGNNEVLSMATRTRPDVVKMTPAEFGAAYRQFLGQLADTGADMAVANLPDVTRIAALRGPGSDVTECRGAGGVLEPVGPDALLSIALDEAKLPVPSCTHVLDSAEHAFVRETVVAFNDEIAAAIDEVEQDRGVTVARVDMFALFDDVATAGYDVHGDGSFVLTTDYLGGVFSLDGIHPSRTGHALIANAFIEAINARFGESIPPVDVARIAGSDPLVGNPFRPDGEVPFGVVANVDVEVEDALDAAFDRLEASADDILDDIRDRFDDLADFLDDLF